MKLFRKLLIIVIAAMLLLMSTACSSTDEGKTNTNVKKEGTQENIKKKDSELKQLTLEEAFAKIDKKEKFVFMVTQSTCSYCNSFKKTLVPFLKEHADIPFFEIEVDMLGTMKADVNKNFEKLQKKVSEFQGGTPEMFCYENGKVKKTISGELTEAALTNWMVDCGFIEGDKVEEETLETYEFKTSKKLKFETLLEVSKRIDEKQSFYLLMSEADRYNQAFIETLIPILEEEDIEIIALKFPIEQGDQKKEDLDKAYQKLMDSLNDMQYSPTVYQIKEGKGKKLLEDNVTAEVIKKALK